MKCFEHFFEPSPNELAALKLVAKFLQESNLKVIRMFMSNISVITLNKFRKRVRGLLRTRISSRRTVSVIDLMTHDVGNPKRFAKNVRKFQQNVAQLTFLFGFKRWINGCL